MFTGVCHSDVSLCFADSYHNMPFAVLTSLRIFAYTDVLMRRWLQRFYRGTSREVRRLEALALSPVYGAFSQAQQAAPALRAFDAQQAFLATCTAAVRVYQRACISGRF